MYNIDIFYRTNANDTGPLLRMNIKFPWSITTLDFGDLTYFWIIFAGVVLSRVFTFSTSSETGKASKMTNQLKNLELIWVPFSAVITLLISQTTFYDWMEIFLYIGGSVLSAVLTVLSISAYRKTRLHKLQYATIAFILFLAFLIYENIEHLLLFDNPITDIIIPSTGLSILVFFFMAETKKT